MEEIFTIRLFQLHLLLSVISSLVSSITDHKRCHNITELPYSSLSREDILHKLLVCSQYYDPKIPPVYFEREGRATNVTIQVRILSIYSVDESAMDYSVDIYFRQTWQDTRLKYHHPNIHKLELDSKMISQVWVPDTYFSNEKEAKFHDVTVPNRLLFIYNNGTVRYSLRYDTPPLCNLLLYSSYLSLPKIGMTLSCYMNLVSYPLDDQSCPMTIESYAYTTDILRLEWAKHEPVQIPSYIGLPQFSISHKDITFTHCDGGYGTDGMFACLKTELFLIRSRGYYIIQIFVPSILVVVLSWVSFWIDIEAVPARISLGLLTVLAMTTQSSGVRATLPRVSYIKAIDIWMATCITFIFGSLLEFAYINVQTRKNNGSKSPNSMMLSEVAAPIMQYRNFRDRARRVDKFSRCAFPVCFILFNTFFWTYFLHI